MANQAELRGDIKRANVTMGGISINHLLLANNFILFCRATCQEWSKLQKILSNYEKGLGKVLNKQKISIFFSLKALQRASHLARIGSKLKKFEDLRQAKTSP